MRIDTVNDVRLVGRALAEGWLNSDPKKKAAAVDAILQVVEESPDPEMQIKAFDVLVKADLADIRRSEMEIKKQVADDERRLRLLEIIEHLSPGEVAKLASDYEADPD